MDEAFALANGERLVVSVLGPGEGRGVTAVQLDAYNFLTRPFDPWMVPTEGAFLAEFLAGTHDPSLADTMLIGRIDGTIVGTAWHGTDRDLPEMGGYGFVFTDPAQRGKGVAQRLTELAIQGFWSAGGQVSYLGTMNPVAQHVYEKHGFCPYNGLTMRALRPGTQPDGFDDRFFSRAGAGEIRDIRMGDIAAYTGLLMLPEPREWIVRDYTEAILYAPPTVEAGGCLRPFYNSMTRHAISPANAWKVLINDRGRMVASANLWAPIHAPVRANATLDFQAAPAYVDRASAVIEAALDHAAAHDVCVIRAYASAEARQDVLREAGFVPEIVHPADLDLGDRRADVTVMRRDLA